MPPYYFLRCLALLLIGLLVYGQTFQFGFVFDDQFFVVTNPYIKNFDQVYVIWHFFPMTRSVGFYSFALNYYFGQLHPQGYHIFNFIVHLAAVGLVWALADLLFRMTRLLPAKDRLTKELPFLIAVIFLVHPCQTQAVTYITQRFESMATVFYLGTVYFYLRARLSKGWTRRIVLFGLSCLFILLGILTKEVVITVPVMILACEWILFPAKDNKRFYFVLTIGGVLFYLLFTKLVHANLSILSHSTPSESHYGEVLTPMGYVLTQMRVFLTFLRLLVLPAHQNLDYDYPVSVGLLHPPLTLAGLGVILSFIFLIIRLRRSAPLIAFGLAWVLITFSVNLVPRPNVIFEHKLYLISFGFILAFVSVLSMLIRKTKVLMLVLLCLIAALAIVSFERNKVWKNEFVLWDDTVRKSPHKARPYNNRGNSYVLQGNFIRAISDYNKAIELNPNFAEAYTGRGFVYEKLGNDKQAFTDYGKALAINPNLAQTYLDRAEIYDKLGDDNLALLDYGKAIATNLDLYSAYLNRGMIYGRRSNYTQAIADFGKAIAINPDGIEAYVNRGFAYSKQGNYSQALVDYGKAATINPDTGLIYSNRAFIYFHTGDYERSWLDVHKAESLKFGIDRKFLEELKKVSGRQE